MNRLSFILTFLFCVLISFRLIAQEPVFSQFYASALYLNPALAGVESETYFGANYRSQWSSLSLPFNTFQASFIQPVFNRGIRKKHLGGVGASVLSDVAGPNKEFASQAISLSAAWNVHLNDEGSHIVSFAVQGGVGQQRINDSKLQWSSQYSPVAGYDPSLPGETSMANMRVFRPIINSGVMWSYTTKKFLSHKTDVSFYHGFALSNLARANSYLAGSDGHRSMMFKSHGGFTAQVSKKLDISPNYLMVVEGVNRQLNIGSYAGYSLMNGRNATLDVKLIAGVWYRLHDGMIYSIGLATAKMNVGFSYDTNDSSMGKTFGYAGAYELSLAYRIPGRNNFRRISSPLI